MRKLLIKLFVLPAPIKVGSFETKVARDFFIIFPLCLIWGMFKWFGMEDAAWITLGALAVASYFGFIHFTLWPANYSEMVTDFQRWQYGLAVRSGMLTVSDPTYDPIDWSVINSIMVHKYPKLAA